MHPTSYRNLIEKAAITNGRPKNQYEKRWGYQIHHIKPCCMFPLRRKDPCAHVSDNLVYLTHKEHLEAHRLLTLVFPSNRDLKFAFDQMLQHSKYRYNAQTGQWYDPMECDPVPRPAPAPARQKTFTEKYDGPIALAMLVADAMLTWWLAHELPKGWGVLAFFFACFFPAVFIGGLNVVTRWLGKK
ncbi:hypothetical protein EX011_21630 [Salmonella enterica]|nr:hypothetical protein [Salmonella enterica]EAW2493129.1 hypothetical protein [Salmonella enterica subsp. enterica]EJF7575703.1 hypothetical protein [Salmonella enterica subsp. enterica]